MFRHWIMFLVFLGFIFFSTDHSLATTPQIAWTQITCTSATSSGIWVTSDSEGNVYACGSTDGVAYGVPAGTKGYIAKYSPAGILAWSNVWTASSIGGVEAAADGSGNVYVAAGRSIRKFDSSGATLWNISLGSQVWSNSIAIDANGYAYVTGGLYDPNQDTFVSKINPSGNILWTTSLHTSLASGGEDIAIDASGNAVIGGFYMHGAPTYTMSGFATKLDTSGNVTWNASFPADVTSVGTDSAGSFYLASSTQMIKYDSANNQEWNVSYSEPCAFLAIDPNGAEYVSGNDIIRKYDSSGNLLDSFPWDDEFSVLAYAHGQLDIAGVKNSVSYGQYSYISNVIVPEPSSFVLLGISAIGLLGYAWRWRRIEI